MIDCIKYKGKYVIETPTERIEINNAITDGMLSAVAMALAGAQNVHVKYIALGLDDTAVTGTETQLGNEFYRQSYTDQSVADNTLTTTFVLLGGEAIGNIREIGVFSGDDATDVANTGILVSRVLWMHNKTAGEEITITRTDMVGR